MPFFDPKTIQQNYCADLKQLSELSPEQPLFAEENHRISLASPLRVFWENVREFFGYANRTEPKYVESHFWQIVNQKNLWDKNTVLELAEIKQIAHLRFNFTFPNPDIQRSIEELEKNLNPVASEQNQPQIHPQKQEHLEEKSPQSQTLAEEEEPPQSLAASPKQVPDQHLELSPVRESPHQQIKAALERHFIIGKNQEKKATVEDPFNWGPDPYEVTAAGEGNAVGYDFLYHPDAFADEILDRIEEQALPYDPADFSKFNEHYYLRIKAGDDKKNPDFKLINEWALDFMEAAEGGSGTKKLLKSALVDHLDFPNKFALLATAYQLSCVHCNEGDPYAQKSKEILEHRLRTLIDSHSEECRQLDLEDFFIGNFSRRSQTLRFNLQTIPENFIAELRAHVANEKRDEERFHTRNSVIATFVLGTLMSMSAANYLLGKLDPVQAPPNNSEPSPAQPSHRDDYSIASLNALFREDFTWDSGDTRPPYPPLTVSIGERADQNEILEVETATGTAGEPVEQSFNEPSKETPPPDKEPQAELENQNPQDLNEQADKAESASSNSTQQEDKQCSSEQKPEADSEWTERLKGFFKVPDMDYIEMVKAMLSPIPYIGLISQFKFEQLSRTINRFKYRLDRAASQIHFEAIKFEIFMGRMAAQKKRTLTLTISPNPEKKLFVLDRKQSWNAARVPYLAPAKHALTDPFANKKFIQFQDSSPMPLIPGDLMVPVDLQQQGLQGSIFLPLSVLAGSEKLKLRFGEIDFKILISQEEQARISQLIEEFDTLHVSSKNYTAIEHGILRERWLKKHGAHQFFQKDMGYLNEIGAKNEYLLPIPKKGKGKGKEKIGRTYSNFIVDFEFIPAELREHTQQSSAEKIEEILEGFRAARPYSENAINDYVKYMAALAILKEVGQIEFFNYVLEFLPISEKNKNSMDIISKYLQCKKDLIEKLKTYLKSPEIIWQNGVNTLILNDSKLLEKKLTIPSLESLNKDFKFVKQFFIVMEHIFSQSKVIDRYVSIFSLLSTIIQANKTHTTPDSQINGFISQIEYLYKIGNTQLAFELFKNAYDFVDSK